MRNLLLIVASFGATILAWGLYGWMLHNGQHAMATTEGTMARLRPFVCVGLAYFLVGVIVPSILLRTRGERGRWTLRGGLMSLFAGALGAIGALGIILAFTFGGRPSFVMPLVFGGAPVVNAFLTIYLARRLREIGPLFSAGLVMVILGTVAVLVSKPDSTEAQAAAGWSLDFVWQLLSILLVVVCWGAYGPTLHVGQSAMDGSRLRPLLCVGLAYFLIAVLVPTSLLAGPMPEASSFYHLGGTLWSLGAGAAGAIGALGIILAFNFGGKPVYVMPLVFGGAPVVNTFATLIAGGQLSQVSPVFLAGLMLVIAGAAMVLVFAPKGHGPAKPAPETLPPATPVESTAEPASPVT